METNKTIGLALSGSGNRTTFYIGFLEVLNENGIKIDYLSSCSGGAVVGAAYACGTLDALKKLAFESTKEDVKRLIQRSKNGGGLYTLDRVEEELRTLITKGARFEDVSPQLAFVAVDINTGEKVVLCMGDIAKAACASSTVPGLVEPHMWGNHALVDGGILTIVPTDALAGWKPDLTIGVNLRATKHIFTAGQLTFKKAFNFLKKILFVEEIESWFKHLFPAEEGVLRPGLFEVWGKSLDLVIKTSSSNLFQDKEPDLMIVPDFPRLKKRDISRRAMEYHYDMGRKAALEYLPKIQELIK